MSTFRGTSPFHQLAPGVKNLLIANLIVFLLDQVSGRQFSVTFGLTPILIFQKFWVWQLLSYSFLHGGFWHLFFNMFVLWMFGNSVERVMGTKAFLRYYFLCVLGAALTQCVLAPYVHVVGASGGIYGIVLAFGLLFPDSIVYLFFILPLRALHLVIFLTLVSLASAVSSGGDKIAHFAHLGGMLAGFLIFKLPVWTENFRLWRASRLFRNPKGRPKKVGPQEKEGFLKNEVDRILDKISTSGIDSLTEEEHKTMKRYAKKNS